MEFLINKSDGPQSELPFRDGRRLNLFVALVAAGGVTEHALQKNCNGFETKGQTHLARSQRYLCLSSKFTFIT